MRHIELNENIGNLAKLNLGPMIKLLNTSWMTGGLEKNDIRGVQRYNPTTRSAENVPQNKANAWNAYYWVQEKGIGPTSEIIDVGEIKNGMKDVRKKLRSLDPDSWTNPQPKGFAFYIGDVTVAFAVFHVSDLRSQKQEGWLTYDLRNFQTELAEILDQINQDRRWDKKELDPTSIRDQEISHYRSDPYIRKIVADKVPMSTCNSLVDQFLMPISKLINQPLTMKVVMADQQSQKKRSSREHIKNDLQRTGNELHNRLIKFKNSKRPTADNIAQFVDMALKRVANVIQFDGQPYTISPKTEWVNSKVSVAEFLRGKVEIIEYQNANPGHGASIRVMLMFDKRTLTIKPIQAKYISSESGKKVNAILDAKRYIFYKFKTIDEKAIIKTILKTVKDQPASVKNQLVLIEAMFKAGYDSDDLKQLYRILKTQMK